MKAVYFAWVRERIGLQDEEIAPPETVVTVAELIEWLRGRGDNYAFAFEHPETVRAAIDHKHCRRDAPIAGAREIAFFPPMTGG